MTTPATCGEPTGIASNRCMLPPGHAGDCDCQVIPGTVEIGGQVMTREQFDAARLPLQIALDHARGRPIGYCDCGDPDYAHVTRDAGVWECSECPCRRLNVVQRGRESFDVDQVFKVSPDQVWMIPARSLTFADLAAANLSRCRRWHPGFPDDETWTGADWANAAGGEAGELAEAALAIVAAVGKLQNTTKKIRRYETGTNTEHDKPLDVLWAEFDAEMADVVCYLDLLATKYGRDLAGAIVAKFNAVSERQGFPERLVRA